MEPRTGQLLLQMKTLADPSRLRLAALCRQGECSVSELARVIGQSQPRVSQHLRQLCDAGLLERFRDGRRVFYRLPAAVSRAGVTAQMLALIPGDDRDLAADAARLERRRASGRAGAGAIVASVGADRALHRALMELTVTAPLGDLLDVGCGSGRLLKLLASRANRAVGVDIDADARQLARAELRLAGLPNCSFRKGDMYQLPFGDHEFDTVILDDVLREAHEPQQVLLEAKRLARAAGRLIVLQRLAGAEPSAEQARLAAWSVAAGLRLAPARPVPAVEPEWLLSVATSAAEQVEAA